MSDSGIQPPKLIGIGGGKGGVGKSVVSVLLSHWLARMGHRTVLVDLDLSGSNLHTLLGIKDPPATLHDLLCRRADHMREIALDTGVERLQVICGASEVLSVANPVFAQKIKLMRKLVELDADYLVLDLGAGTSFDVLDFFLLSDYQIVVTAAEPIAVFNAYGFLRNAVFRRLWQLGRHRSILRECVQQAMDPKNELNIRTVRNLYQRIHELGGSELLNPIRKEMSRIHPAIIVNRIREARQAATARVLQQVAGRYLMLEVSILPPIGEDPDLGSLVERGASLATVNGYRGAAEAVRKAVVELNSYFHRSRGSSAADSSPAGSAPVVDTERPQAASAS